MIKVQKTFFRIIFFLLIFGGFFGQSFASILSIQGNSTSENKEFRLPSKKSSFQSLLFVDSEEEFGEKEDSFDESEWGDDGNNPDHFTLFPLSSLYFGMDLGAFIPYPTSPKFSQEKTFSNFLVRPLYDRFHQWKFDLIVNF